jgi:hypothetical protein
MRIVLVILMLLSPVNVLAQSSGYGDNFGAVAFSPRNGAVGYSYNYRSRDDAEQRALEECGHDCRIVMWFKNACGGLAGGARDGYGADWGDNQREAGNIAIRSCHANTTDCGAVRWVCTAGSSFPGAESVLLPPMRTDVARRSPSVVTP